MPPALLLLLLLATGAAPLVAMTGATPVIVDVIPCAGEVSLAAATQLCTARSAQLCSRADLNGGAARDARCGLDRVRIWSTTTCVNNKDPGAEGRWVVYGQGNDQGMCSLTAPNNKHAVVCCRSPSTASPSSAAPTPEDNNYYGEPPTSPPTSQPVAQPTTASSSSGLFFSPQPCTQYNFAQAGNSCAQGGGRLCSREELLGPVFNRKSVACSNILNKVVWSSTPCVNPKNPDAFSVWGTLGLGFNAELGGNGGSQCAVADETHDHFVMCCSDQGVPPATFTPTTPTTPTTNPPQGSGSLPQFFTPKPCDEYNLAMAGQMCAAGASGGRLCTKDEVFQYKKKEVDCSSLLKKRVWTSTTCVNPKNPQNPAVWVGLAAGPDPRLPNGGWECAQATDFHDHFVLCCADPVTSTPMSPPTSPTTAQPTIPPQPAASRLLLPAFSKRSPRMASNVLMLIVDDLKPVLSSFGETRVQTPNMDRLASRGVRFARAHAQVSSCAPSRASFLTSTRPDRNGVYDVGTYLRVKLTNAVTLGQALKSAGFRSLATGKVQDERCVVNGDEALSTTAPVTFIPRSDACYDKPLFFCKSADGWDPSQCKCVVSPGVKPDPDEDTVVPSVQIVASNVDADYVDTRMADQAVTQLTQLMQSFEQDPVNKRFVYAVGFRKPHLPFAAPKRFFDAISLASLQLPAVTDVPNGPKNAYTLEGPSTEINSYSGPQGTNADSTRALIRGYLACVTYIDTLVGKFIDALDASEVGTHETLVVLLGDHGFHLGDHGTWGKHNVLEESTRVPLVFVPPPGRKDQSTSEWNVLVDGGKVVREPVQLVDVAPTILDLLGVTPSTKAAYAGEVASDPMASASELTRWFVQADGRSLRPLLTSRRFGTATWTSRYAVSQYLRLQDVMGYSIRSNRYRFVAWIEYPVRQGAAQPTILAQEFYDYLEDPNESRNAVVVTEYQAVVVQMRAALIRAIMRTPGAGGSHPETFVPGNLPGDEDEALAGQDGMSDITPVLPAGLSGPVAWWERPDPFAGPIRDIQGSGEGEEARVRYGFELRESESGWWEEDLVQRALWTAVRRLVMASPPGGPLTTDLRRVMNDTACGVDGAGCGFRLTVDKKERRRRHLAAGGGVQVVMFDVWPLTQSEATELSRLLGNSPEFFLFQLDQALQALYYSSPTVVSGFVPSQEVAVAASLTPLVVVVGVPPTSTAPTTTSPPPGTSPSPSSPVATNAPVTAPPSSAPTTGSLPSGEGLSGGAIAGIVIAVLVCVVFGVCFGVWWGKRQAARDQTQQQQQQQGGEKQGPQSPTPTQSGGSTPPRPGPQAGQEVALV